MGVGCLRGRLGLQMVYSGVTKCLGSSWGCPITEGGQRSEALTECPATQL